MTIAVRSNLTCLSELGFVRLLKEPDLEHENPFG